MEIKNWVILNNGARLDQRKLEEFANGMCKAGYYQGMKIAAPSQIFNIRNQQDLDNKVSFLSIFTIKDQLIRETDFLKSVNLIQG